MRPAPCHAQTAHGLRMSRPDLNLLVTLDVLLSEGSVARAARRLRLSPSAMSRALARLREVTGDPLLVRAGSRPCPHAARDRASRSGRPAGGGGRSGCAPPRSSGSNGWSGRSRCGAAKGLWKTFAPAFLPVVASRRPASGLRSCRSWTRTAPHFATGSRSGNRRRREGNGSGTACAGIVPRSFHRRRANGAPA